MGKRSPIITLMGKLPARGRADVKYDFLRGKQAAKHGDREMCLKMARSLGSFALRHVPFVAIGAAAAFVHFANVRAGNSEINARHLAEGAYTGLYSIMQGCVIYTQAKLARTLYKRAAELPTSVEVTEPESAIPHENPTMLDKRFSDVAHGLFALSVVDAAITLNQNI